MKQQTPSSCGCLPLDLFKVASGVRWGDGVSKAGLHTRSEPGVGFFSCFFYKKDSCDSPEGMSLGLGHPSISWAR